MKKTLLATVALMGTGLAPLSDARAVTMADYTSFPIFIGQTVPPNILFIADFSDAMLPAAFGSYPLSFSTTAGNCADYCSNHAGLGLTVTDTETFNPSKTYFGMFEPLSCYSVGSGDFRTRTAKSPAVTSTACATGKWDGNFLNWVSMRKIDQAKKVLIGGRTLSASNNDGTANTLLGEPKTGLNGSTNTCSNTSNPCYRYVKFVRSSLLSGHYDTSLSAADTAWQATGQAAGPGSVTTLGTAVLASATVSSTTFTTTFSVGDSITIGGVSRVITAIASDSSLTVASFFSASAITNSGYSKNLQPGSVEVQAGSLSTVRGTDTSFKATDVGRAIKIGTVISEVTAVTSATELTVSPAFSAAIAAGASYSFFDPSAAAVPGSVSVVISPASKAATVNGTSTQFKNGPYSFVANDIIKVGTGASAQFRSVASNPNNDTSLTVSADFTAAFAAGTAYKKFTAGATSTAGPGSVDVAAGSTTVTANATVSLTTFTTTFKVGDTIQVGTGGSAQSRTITAISSDASLTVDTAFSPDFATGQTYFNVSVSLEGPGTVSVTSGGTTVTGAGTNFLTRFAVGEQIKVGSDIRTITAIASDTSLTVSAAFSADQTGSNYNGPDGVFFGSGEGKIYVNGDSSPVPFDAASARQFPIQVDLTAETDAFRMQESLGLLQNLRTDNMRVAVMFTNSTNGKAATLFREFDGIFNASAITGIRNQPLSQFAALGESAYEGLCYYRNSQGACYDNNPADFTASVAAQGDPFFFVSNNQSVSCCKSFILMISSGIPSGDGDGPDKAKPFGNLLDTSESNVGLATTQLDDVAFYGQTHDVRDQASGTTGFLTGTQKVTFYAVNAMGGVNGAAVLSSAAKFGGFEDRNGDGKPDEKGQNCTFPATSNLGTGAGVSSLEWDLDKDCTPDTFFDASEGGDLEKEINRAIADILKKAASGTSVSVLATSSTGEGAIYQAYFFPSQFEGLNEVKWFGFTQGLFIDTFGNIREDYSATGCSGAPDGRLVLEHDCIIKLRFDTTTNEVRVERFKDDGSAPGSKAGDGVADGPLAVDTNGDGILDSPAPFETVGLKDVKPIWEAGARLAYTDPGASCTTTNAGVSCRRILTWTDADSDKAVAATGEVIEFTEANKDKLCPYLAGTNVATCVSGGAGGAGQTEAANIIKFHRGEDGVPFGLRDRTITVRNPDDVTSTATKVWKLGDVVDATPTVVGAPQERFDIIYGDDTYATFFQQYKTRRQVAYVGANDGMLHAFNAGFFTAGDDTSTPEIEHGAFGTVAPASVTSYTSARSNPKRGAELWAFIPQELLPHLKWYTQTDYTHVYYMDLKPKVTDARIFSPDTDHPGGWGTILIAGMRFGGSCGACTSTQGGTPMTVTADFGSGDQTRAFYSAYIVLDITNPEKDPTLLWVFTDSTLGLTTSFPAVLRVSPTGDGKLDNTNAKWRVVFGTGPTGYTGDSTQVSKFFVVDMQTGPGYTLTSQTSGTLHGTACSGGTPCKVAVSETATAKVRAFSTGDISTSGSGCSSSVPCGSFIGDIITLDANLDYRVDAIYAGNVIGNGTGTPKYFGKLYHITTGSSTDTATWGIASGPNRIPTVLVATFAYTPSPSPTTCATASPCKVGPITAAPGVSADETSNIWIFFGTGRFFTAADKTSTDLQHFFGVKDCIVTGICKDQTVQRNNLFNVSSVEVCIICAGDPQVTGAGSAITSFEGDATNSLVGTIKGMDGWFTTLPNSTTVSDKRERALSAPTILGGTVFFTTFIPTNDLCTAAGDGNLYALFFTTGSAYKESTIGVTKAGDKEISTRSISLGTGLPSQMAVQIGGKGTGGSGTSGSGAGCAGRVTGFIQASTGVLGQVCGKPALSFFSRMLAWRDL